MVVDVKDVQCEVVIMSTLSKHPIMVKLRAAYVDSENMHLGFHSFFFSNLWFFHSFSFLVCCFFLRLKLELN